MSFIGIILVFVTCTNFESQSIINTNIDPGDEIFSDMYCSSGDCYLIGEGKNQGVIYKADLTSNLSYWKRIDIPPIENGEITYENKESLFIVENPRNDSGKVIALKKKELIGKVIDTVQNTLIKLFCIDDMSSKSISIINRFRGRTLRSDTYELIISDSTENVDRINLNRSVITPTFNEGIIYFISSEQQSWDMLYNIKIADKSKDSLLIEDAIKSYNIVSSDNYWLLTEKKDRLNIIHFQNGKIDTKTNLPFNEEGVFGKAIHVYNNTIAILTGQIDKGLLMGLGGAKSKLWVSHNKGKNWKEIHLPRDYYVKPYCFVKDEKFIAYSGFGEITAVSIK